MLGDWFGSLEQIEDDKGYWLVYNDIVSGDEFDCSDEFDIVGIPTVCEDVTYEISHPSLISYLGADGAALDEAIDSD